MQLTSDGHKPHLKAGEQSLGADIDYAMLVKIYGDAPGQGRYSPGECIGAVQRRVEGNPNPAHISTSYAERANLSMRMGMRRFTRLTNAFSKKAENHAHAPVIYLMHYNFARLHWTLRCTPATAAGVTTTQWDLSEDAFADIGRTVLDVLRREGRPVALPEVARRVVALRGLDPSSGAVLAAIEGSAGRALRHQRTLGTVRNPRKEGRVVLWRIVC